MTYENLRKCAALDIVKKCSVFTEIQSQKSFIMICILYFDSQMQGRSQQVLCSFICIVYITHLLSDAYEVMPEGKGDSNSTIV